MALRKEIPCVEYDELVSDDFIKHLGGGEPVIVRNSNVVRSDRWNSQEKIRRQLAGTEVTCKQSKTCRFRYFDAKLNKGGYEFVPPTTESKMKWVDVEKRIKEINDSGEASRLYVQESLSGHPEMVEEFRTWSWEWLQKLCARMNWGLPDTNELFIGMRDCETPLHMDERENMFYQVAGEKEILLFNYLDYPKMYLFPCGHPCDRQSMVDVNNPSDEQPKFRECTGWHAVLRAGDLLYIPYGWFHWLKNIEDFTVSISFWSHTVPNPTVTPTLEISESMLMRVRRNMEGLIGQMVGEHNMKESMLTLKTLLNAGCVQAHPLWKDIHYFMSAVKIPESEHKDFVLSIIEGRFDIDVTKYV